MEPHIYRRAVGRETHKGDERMIVKLLTPEEYVKEMEKIAALAALTCRANTEKEYEPSEVLGRIIKAGHESVLEHITLTYSVKGLSRACLQELARHRHISLSVESTDRGREVIINVPSRRQKNICR